MSMLWMAVAGWFLVLLQYQERTQCSFINICFGKFLSGIIHNAVTSWELLWAEVARRLDITVMHKFFHEN